MQLYREEFSVKCKQQLIPEHDVHDRHIVVLKNKYGVPRFPATVPGIAELSLLDVKIRMEISDNIF